MIKLNNKIKIGICGYGNLGKGVEKCLSANTDMELVAIFTRRNNLEIASNAQIININEIEDWKDKIDVMILCGGSAKDLPKQAPVIAGLFNTIDSFDTHADIPEYLSTLDKVALENNKLSIISIGWDPGVFSINRLISESILPTGTTYTFWGKGVSQGHSDAIRQIEGVKNAVQYTIPVEDAINRVRNGEKPLFETKDKHLRECYVVVEECADLDRIEKEIKTMPKYFSDYITTVNFITEQELKENHSSMPHGGFVIRTGNTSEENKQLIEYSLKLDSNPEFTASVLIAYARACYRMVQSGEIGAKTIFDVPPYMLSSKSREELIKELL